MAQVNPFRGIRYTKEKVPNSVAVICPPYDVITPEKQKFYYHKSDYNAVCLELPAQQRGESPQAKYGGTAVTFRNWLDEGVLRMDSAPAFYLHDHYFVYRGRTRRRELIARVKLVPWGKGVYPHEEISHKVKQDRLELLRACQASFSPILALYQDKDNKIAEIFSSVTQYSPPVAVSDSGEHHLTWAITESRVIRRISELLAKVSFYVADGHHRYETALAYQQERKEGLASPGGDEPYDYIMMSLVEFSDPGLVVLPIHRLVRGVSVDTRAELNRWLTAQDLFAVESIPLANERANLAEDVFRKLRPAPAANGEEGIVMGILGLEGETLTVLRQRPGVSIGGAMPRAHSQAYNELDVSVLNHLVLEGNFGTAFNEDNIGYTTDIDEAYREITEGNYQLAFIIQPPGVEMAKAVADAGDRMPRKSTYFYPKAPAGLIINPLW